MNDRRHWAVKASLKREWKQATFLAARQQLGPKPPALPPSLMQVTFPVKVNRRRDSDNPHETTKVIADALVLYGAFPDDTPEWLETMPSRFVKGATDVVVELIPRTQDAA